MLLREMSDNVAARKKVKSIKKESQFFLCIIFYHVFFNRFFAILTSFPIV